MMFNGDDGVGDAKAEERRARGAKYDLYTLGLTELFLVITLVSFLVASGSELYGFLVLHLLSVSMSFALPAIVRRQRDLASYAPIAFMPSAMVDSLLVFALGYACVQCLDGQETRRLDLVLGSNVCQGSSFDSGFVELLVLGVSVGLLFTTFQEAFASANLAPASQSGRALVTSLAVARCAILLFKALWFVVQGSLGYAVLETGAALAALVDLGARWSWAAPTSLALDAPCLIPALANLAGLCSARSAWCPHDTAASAWALLGMSAFKVASGVFITVRRARRPAQGAFAGLKTIRRGTLITSLAGHALAASAGALALHSYSAHWFACGIWLSVFIHVVGSLVILGRPDRRSNVVAALVLFAVAALADCAFIVVSMASVSGACASGDSILGLRCIGPEAAFTILCICVVMTCADGISIYDSAVKVYKSS